LKSFWSYLSERDPRTARNAKGLVALSLLSGLAIGLVAARWALILSTLGGATLLASSVDTAFASLMQKPALFGLVIGGFFLTSLVLQGLLARPAKSESSE
jgi:hypothetical protein